MNEEAGGDIPRDPVLVRALQNAPDRALEPRHDVRRAIHLMAYRAVEPEPEVIDLDESIWQMWRRRLVGGSGTRRSLTATFATLLIAGFVTLLWQREPIPGARLDSETAIAPAPALPPPAAPMTPSAPEAAPQQEPAAPAAEAAATPPPPVVAAEPAPPTATAAAAAAPAPAPAVTPAQVPAPAAVPTPAAPVAPAAPAPGAVVVPPAGANSSAEPKPPAVRQEAPPVAKPGQGGGDRLTLGGDLPADEVPEPAPSAKARAPAAPPAAAVAPPPPAAPPAPKPSAPPTKPLAPATPPSGPALAQIAPPAADAAVPERRAAARAREETIAPPRAAPPGVRTDSTDPPTFAALSQWRRVTILRTDGSSRNLSREEVADLAPLLGSAALSAVTAQDLPDEIEYRVVLERANGDRLASLDIAGNWVRWREGRTPPGTGAPSAGALSALREALRQALDR